LDPKKASKRRTPLFYLFGDRRVRRNVWALLKAVLFIIIVVMVYSILFHLIMVYVEGRPSSLFTGLYWTLTTMSTVGYGDAAQRRQFANLFGGD